MLNPQSGNGPSGSGAGGLSFRARPVTVEQSAAWLEEGWLDFKRAPGLSLGYGGIFTFVGWLLIFGLKWMGMESMILPLAGGFLLLAPLLAVCFYEISRRLAAGEVLAWRSISAGVLVRAGRLADITVVFLMIFLVWMLVAILLFNLFFGGTPPPAGAFISHILATPWFLAIGTTVGAFFAALTYLLGVVSIPLLYDRPVDAVTAMRVSIAVVSENRRVMGGWAVIVAITAGLGLSLFLVGIAVTLPILGYATWHAYEDLVELAP